MVLVSPTPTPKIVLEYFATSGAEISCLHQKVHWWCPPPFPQGQSGCSGLSPGHNSRPLSVPKLQVSASRRCLCPLSVPKLQVSASRRSPEEEEEELTRLLVEDESDGSGEPALKRAAAVLVQHELHRPRHVVKALETNIKVALQCHL